MIPDNFPQGTFFYLPNKDIDKTIPCDTVSRIMDHKMAPDTLSHSTRSSITTFRTLLLITLIAVSCTLCTISFSFAAELFPFSPPSASQQRSVEQQPAARPQLSQEDMERISRIATQAKQLSAPDRNQLKNSIQKSLNEAAANGNLNQVKYFGELLRQID